MFIPSESDWTFYVSNEDDAASAGGSSDAVDVSPGAAGSCLPDNATSCIHVPRNIVPVACKGIAADCCGAVDCPCHACIELARAAVSLGSGRLCLLLHKGDDAPRVYRLSKSQGPDTTIASLAAYDWSQAHILVDPCCPDYVSARFPDIPLPNGRGYIGSFVYFDHPYRLAEEGDVDLLAWSQAEALRKEQWWQQRAVAILLGLHLRAGASSALRVLHSDAVRHIIRIMWRLSGPGRDSDPHPVEPSAVSGGACAGAAGGCLPSAISCMCLSRIVPIAACKREHRPVFWAEHVLQRKLCLTQPVYSSQALRLTEEEGGIPTPALVRQTDQVRF